jgi:glycosyltransferase involved in cell wall biosynthesis
MSKASDLRVAGRIEYLGMMPRTALLQYSRLSHVGLVLIPRDNLNINMTFMIGASCKSFDYLACGLPVLVSDLPDWRKMFVDSGYGLACDPGDSRSIVDAVRWLIQHPDAFQQMSQAGQQQIIKEWNYEKQCEAISPIFKSTACLPL